MSDEAIEQLTRELWTVRELEQRGQFGDGLSGAIHDRVMDLWDYLDYDIDLAMDNESATITAEATDVVYEGDTLYLWCNFGTHVDSVHGEMHFDSTGGCSVEWSTEEGYYFIFEDLEMAYELFERDMPDVGKRHREAVQERKARRREYERMVMPSTRRL